MSAFWVFAGALALGVAALLALPILKYPRESATRAEYDVNVYKDQLAELERDAKMGRIDTQELEAARLEIQRRLLAAADAVEVAKTKASKSSPWPLVACVCAVPIFALVGYLQLGAPGVPAFPLAERTDLQVAADQSAAAPHEGGAMPAPVGEMVARLEERLREDPSNVDGWILLARSYVAMGEMDKAAAAYERAAPLTDRHPSILADWAEARLMANEGVFTERIFNDFVEAREKDPTHPKPWFYIGLDKAMSGDLRGAAQLWTDVLAIAPADAPFAASVREQILRASQDGGFDPAELKPSDAARQIASGIGRQTPAESAPGPTREDVEAAQEMSIEDRQAFIRSMVERLAMRLEENPDDRAGWQRLIRAYEVLGDTDKAADARAKLDALGN